MEFYAVLTLKAPLTKEVEAACLGEVQKNYSPSAAWPEEWGDLGAMEDPAIDAVDAVEAIGNSRYRLTMRIGGTFRTTVNAEHESDALEAAENEFASADFGSLGDDVEVADIIISDAADDECDSPQMAELDCY